MKRESIQEQLERCDYNIKKMKRNLKISYEIKIACEENVPGTTRTFIGNL